MLIESSLISHRMSSQVQRAVLLDLHVSPSPPSSSPSDHIDHLHPSRTSSAPPCNYCNVVKNVTNLLLNNHTCLDLVHLYLLTSAGTDTGSVAEQTVSSEGQDVHFTVVEAETRIASFYRAKQTLDDLEVTNIILMCHAGHKQFWTYVCQELLTPVHEWEVAVAQLPLRNDMAHTDETPRTISNDHLSQSELPICNDLQNLLTLTHEPNAGRASNHIGRPESTTQDGSSRESSEYHPHSSQLDALDVDSSQRQWTAESVRAEVRSFLKTLPSLLGLPEVDRSLLLPGEGQGFVHGFSTRRGGVTSVGTLCSMNLMYTDKKPDSRLVVEENRRRLSLAGGFDPRTFHIVRVEHGHRVWTVGDEQPPKFDALITNRRDVTIAAAGADCIPLLFADPVAMVVGAAHAGWLGSAERVAECVVNAMGERFGSRPEDIRVSMGPGLRLGCFKVLEEDGRMFAEIHPSCQVDSVQPVCHVIHKGGRPREDLKGCFPGDEHLQVHATSATLEQFETQSGSDCVDREEPEVPLLVTQAADERGSPSTSVVNTLNNVDPRMPTLSKRLLGELRVEHIPAERLKPKTQRPRKSSRVQWTFVDLQMTNYHVLLQAGVKAEHIDMSTSHCTRCNPDLYFSYERDGFPFGNQIGFISMPSRLSH